MKLKIGDKVRIRPDLKAAHEKKRFGLGLNQTMIDLSGKVATILRFNEQRISYEIDLDNGNWYWSVNMFQLEEPNIYDLFDPRALK